MLALPSDDPTDPIQLADWLELYAVISPDLNSSRGDLESVLRTASISELADDEEIERKVLDVFNELEQRAESAGESYPFAFDYAGVLQLKSMNWEDFPIYMFCLCLSYYPLRETRVGPKLFERISCWAAKGYLHGSAVGFGAPREELPSSFDAAVVEMCRLIGEGEYREQPSLHRQDDTLDLVAWKDFVDRKPSKILMFGQCGAGRNWTDKLGELQPDVFWNQWLAGLVSPFPMRSFFTPYRVQQEMWELHARKAGILFDRCRVAFWAHQQQDEADLPRLVAWVEDFLAQGLS